jgi:predicted secreted protein
MQSYGAYGTLLKIGDGGVGTAVKASRTVGTGSSALTLTAKNPGTAGNAISFVIIENGNNTPISVSVISTAITINLATSGGGTGTSTVNDVIAALAGNAQATALIDASAGSGGTGVMLPAAVGNLTGGTAGSEIFTTIDGVRSLTGPTFSMETIDATHHTSGGQYREIIPSFKSGGEVSFDLVYDPNEATHIKLIDDYESRVRRNFQIVLPDVGSYTYLFGAYVQGAELNAPIDDVLQLSCTLGVDGEVQRF